MIISSEQQLLYVLSNTDDICIAVSPFDPKSKIESIDDIETGEINTFESGDAIDDRCVNISI